MSDYEQRQAEIAALKVGLENLDDRKLVICEDLSEAVLDLRDTPIDDHTYLEMHAKKVARLATELAAIVAHIFANQYEILEHGGTIE